MKNIWASPLKAMMFALDLEGIVLNLFGGSMHSSTMHLKNLTALRQQLSKQERTVV